jgi:hypothetical protein
VNGLDWLQLALLQTGAINNAGALQADSSAPSAASWDVVYGVILSRS